MPNLTLYIDLSPDFISAFTAIQGHSIELKHGEYHIPEPSMWNFGRIRSHQPLWGLLQKQKQISQELPLFWHNEFKKILKIAQQGHNILIYGREASPLRQKAFLDILRSQTELMRYTIQVVAVIGRPACLLEQYARLIWPGKSPASSWFSLVRAYAQLTELIHLWREELGEENLLLFGDTSDSPTISGLSAGHIAAMASLGIPESPLVDHMTHLLSLASREARHFLLASKVRGNAWPRLDEAQFTAYLQKQEYEAAWDHLPMCEPKYRAALNNHARNFLPQLEEALQLEPGTLACSEELSPANPWRNYSGLSNDAIHSFCDSLPEDIAYILLQRFGQDSHLLGPGQQRIYQCLTLKKYPRAYSYNFSERQPIVSVLTLTRNQEKYISQCIESVLSQKTNFYIQHIILDHCSTDNTADIINCYSKKYKSIKPIFLSEWRNGQNVTGLFSRCRTKYAALCDGDDYFIDPLKLQKQVEFLESHQECSICFHPVDVIYEDGSPSRIYPPDDILPRGIRTFYTLKDLFFANFIQTNSVMYRWRFSNGLPQWFDPTLIPGDWYWHLLHAENGLIGYLNDRMSVYRRHSKSLYASAEVNHISHRQLHGLNELRTYHVVNQHFNNKYYSDLCVLASGVLADFLHIYKDTDDDSLLVKASELFPDFTHNFLHKLKKV